MDSSLDFAQKLQNFAQKLQNHVEQYEKLPIEQMPNFGLGRPLNKDEMHTLKLIAQCVAKAQNKVKKRIYYYNWLSSMVLIGDIENFLKKATKAKELGYWVCLGGNMVPFPPKVRGL